MVQTMPVFLITVTGESMSNKLRCSICDVADAAKPCGISLVLLAITYYCTNVICHIHNICGWL